MEPPPAPPPALLEELLEEVFFRLPPDEPAHLVRASLVCRPWRRILADRGFRRRYGEFHRTPLLLGFLANLAGEPQSQAVFVPTSAFCPAEANRPQWIVIDCRHGRVLLAHRSADNFDLAVWDPMTGDWRALPSREKLNMSGGFSAAVLCTAGGCDHRGCQGGPFRVAVVLSGRPFLRRRTNGAHACLYSSETGAWSEFTSLFHADTLVKTVPSVFVGDALYFSTTTRDIFKYQPNSLRLSELELPLASQDNGRLITTQDGGLGYAVVEGMDLILFSGEETIGTGGAVGWARRRVIDINSLLPHDALLDPAFTGRLLTPRVNGFVEGTQVIFVSTSVCVYMVELQSGRVTKVLDHDAEVLLPYMSFCIPVFSAMEAASSSPRRKLSWCFKCIPNFRR